MRKKKSNLKAIDFFCGGGGMTYGIRKSGIEVLAGIDIDPECEKTYINNNPNSKFINIDINELTPVKLKGILNINKNDDNLIFVGCSPCQYWSIINTDKSKSQKSKNLLISFQKFIKFFKPGHVVIENVPGLLSRNDSPLTLFLKFLDSAGYSYNYSVVNAQEFGVPQTRRRFVLIASRVTEDIDLLKPQHKPKVRVKDFIGKKNGIPRLNAGMKDEKDPLHVSAGLSDINIKRMKLTPKSGGTRLSWKKYKSLQLKTYIGRDDSFRDVYGRMCWDKPAPTITTKFFSISNGRFGHPSENRAISLREGACLQTFPKSYKFFTTSIASTARLIGNAVPPKLAYYIGKSITEMSCV